MLNDVLVNEEHFSEQGHQVKSGNSSWEWICKGQSHIHTHFVIDKMGYSVTFSNTVETV